MSARIAVDKPVTRTQRHAGTVPKSRGLDPNACLAALVRNAPASMFVLDGDGTIAFANTSELPLRVAELPGCNIADAIAVDAEPLRDALDSVVRTGTSRTLEVCTTTENGQRWYCAFMKRSDDLADTPRVLLFLSDITERRQANEALRRIVQELEESSEGKDAAAPLRARPPPAVRQLSGLAVVVEEQAATRRTMMRSLQNVGFNVIEACTGEEALAVIVDLDARVDLLVTDVALPGLSGIELAQALRGRQPELRVLVCSGYMGREQDSGLVLDQRTAFLAKPFTGQELVSKATELF